MGNLMDCSGLSNISDPGNCGLGLTWDPLVDLLYMNLKPVEVSVISLIFEYKGLGIIIQKF